MASGVNRFGLRRSALSAAIKREVRRHCGFGCAICGSAIYTYEHFDPPFAQARQHSAAGITLLCSDHQTQSFKGLLSKSTIAAHNAQPFAKTRNYVSHLFDIGTGWPEIEVGTLRFQKSQNILMIADVVLLSIKPPEQRSRVWRISARFFDENDRLTAEIVDNEIRVAANNFDFEQIGNRFVVFGPDRSEVLRVELDPPTRLVVRNCLFRHAGSQVAARGSHLRVDTPTCKDARIAGGQWVNFGIFIDKAGNARLDSSVPSRP